MDYFNRLSEIRQQLSGSPAEIATIGDLDVEDSF